MLIAWLCPFIYLFVFRLLALPRRIRALRESYFGFVVCGKTPNLSRMKLFGFINIWSYLSYKRVLKSTEITNQEKERQRNKENSPSRMSENNADTYCSEMQLRVGLKHISPLQLLLYTSPDKLPKSWKEHKTDFLYVNCIAKSRQQTTPASTSKLASMGRILSSLLLL